MKHVIILLFCVLLSPSVFATETTKDLLTIDFKYGGAINKPTKCVKSEITKIFPDFIVEKTNFDDTYRENAKGFHVRLTPDSEPVFSLSCVDVDEGKESGSSYYGAENKTGDYVFLVRTRSHLVSGPNNATVGKTTYADMKDLPWNKSVEGGCSFGQNDFKNTMVCYNDKMRALFIAPTDYEKPLRRAPPQIIDNAVLFELLYWPGLTDK